ncbi:MAG TPA: lytic transglycosylase domain-containing protein [Vicinamibacteria bacterium]|nr:lytic transglycosylase domain-containing protein [Vicinamibacteria bacterium]
MDHPKEPQDASRPQPDRRRNERRQGERRDTFATGGRSHHIDRRRSDRRARIGAGLLASMAFAIGGHQVLARKAAAPELSFALPDRLPAPSTPASAAATPKRAGWDRESLEPIIQEAAALHGLSASLIRAVIQTESQFNPMAVSRVGAKGLMQLMPITARHVGIENPFDPRENVLGGTKYLSSMLRRFDGNTARALAAYNAGPTTVARYRGVPPYRETQGYVRKIHKLVADTDAAFSLPAQKRVVRKASLKSRRASARKASVRKASVSKASVRKAPVRKASVSKAKKKAPVRRAVRGRG